MSSQAPYLACLTLRPLRRSALRQAPGRGSPNEQASPRAALPTPSSSRKLRVLFCCLLLVVVSFCEFCLGFRECGTALGLDGVGVSTLAARLAHPSESLALAKEESRHSAGRSSNLCEEKEASRPALPAPGIRVCGWRRCTAQAPYGFLHCLELADGTHARIDGRHTPETLPRRAPAPAPQRGRALQRVSALCWKLRVRRT